MILDVEEEDLLSLGSCAWCIEVAAQVLIDGKPLCAECVAIVNRQRNRLEKGARKRGGSKWREHARTVILRVLQETAGCTHKEVRRAMRDAYPFGDRKYHPYRIWCDELARLHPKETNEATTRNRGRDPEA